MNVHIFHHNDLDGYSAGYLAYKYELNKDSNNVLLFYVMDYNKEFPLDKISEGDKVYILDYSIHPTDMIKLLRITNNIIWIDHHISAINKYEDYQDLIEETNNDDDIKGFRLNGLCGAALTYLYLYKNYREDAQIELRDTVSNELEFYYQEFKSEAPYWLKLVNSWDVWLHDESEDEFLQIATSNVLSIDLIETLDLDKKSLDNYIEKGKHYVEYRNQWSNQFMERYGFETIIEDLDGKPRLIYVANLGNANSKFFGRKIDEYSAVVTQCFNGVDWNYSIYSNKDYFDCSKIAQFFGGGGHKGAAGFRLDKPFTKNDVVYTTFKCIQKEDNTNGI